MTCIKKTTIAQDKKGIYPIQYSGTHMILVIIVLATGLPWWLKKTLRPHVIFAVTFESEYYPFYKKLSRESTAYASVSKKFWHVGKYLRKISVI